MFFDEFQSKTDLPGILSFIDYVGKPLSIHFYRRRTIS